MNSAKSPECPEAAGRRRCLYKRRPQASLEAAVAELVDALGGLAAAAAVAGVSPSTMGRYTDPDAGEQVPLARAALLEAAAGRAPVTTWLAQWSGATVSPPAPRNAEADWAASVNALIERGGESVQALVVSLADDGAVDAQEAAQVLPALDRHAQQVAAVRARVQAVYVGGVEQ